MRLSVFVLAIICLCSESYAQNVNIDKCGIGVRPIGDATTYVRTHPSSSSRNTVYYVPWSYKGSFKIGGGSQYSCGGSNMYFYNCVINPPGSAIYSQFTDAVPVIWSGGAKLEEGFDELYGCPPPHFGSPCFREQSSFPPKPDHSVESVGNYYPYIKVPKPDGTATYDVRWEYTVIDAAGNENVSKFESNSHTFIAGTEPTVEQYHSIKDNPQFSPERLINNDNAFQVCADGATATIFKIKFDGEDPYKGWTIRIRDPSNNPFQPLGSLNSLTGLQSRVDEAIFEYTHPEYIVGNSKQYDLVLELIDYSYHENVVKTYPLKIHRAPVLMVHGLWSNPSTFDAMTAGLTDLYTPGLLFRMDYEITNSFPISFNLPQVPHEIRNAISALANKGISAGKVDYIGHSMGGLLGRLYLKNYEEKYNNDIRRFITINTPHLGSQWADKFSDADSSPPFHACGLLSIWLGNFACNNGALQDLRTDGETIRYKINGYSRNEIYVPSHAISTWVDVSKAITDNPYGKFLYISDYDYNLRLELYLEIQKLFGNLNNDLIVSIPSQLGGNNAFTIVPEVWHGSLSNQTVIQTVKDLLKAQTTDRFSRFNNINNSARLARALDIGNVNNTASSATIQIISPIKGSKITEGSTYNVEVKGTGLLEIFSAMTYSSDSIFASLSEGTSFLTSVIDDQKFWGKRNMIVIGKTLDGSIVTDTTHFYLGESGDALPLRLLDFRGRKVENAGRLDWSVTDMHHFSHFEVERSGDGMRFERYGYIVSGESYSEKSSFSFLDTRPLPGINYYRLKMIDLDGSFSYSGFVSIGFDGVGGEPAVYPNPATSMLYFSDSGRLSGVSLVDAVGRVVLSTDNPRELENGLQVIGLSGAYVIILRYRSEKVVTRTIVINGR